MTKAEMKRIIILGNEIRKIEAEIEKPKRSTVVVFYKDYKYGHGVPKAKQETDYGETHIRILRGSLKQYLRELRGLLFKAEEFIDSIDDSKIRTILRMYYINGESQTEIAKELGIAQSVISSRMNKFWKCHAADELEKNS